MVTMSRLDNLEQNLETFFIFFFYSFYFFFYYSLYLNPPSGPTAHDKNELTSTMSRLDNLEQNLETYRIQTRQLVRVLVESRFDTTDRILLDFMKLQVLMCEG